MSVETAASPPEVASAVGGRARGAALLFRTYKNVISPALGQCKHLPTCSEYAYVAVVRHGWLRGGWMALQRLARCHPLARGGYDPVP